MRIIGPPSASLNRVTTALSAMGTSVNPTFITQMVPQLWEAGVSYGIDPVGLIAQSAKETGYGNFRGAVHPEFCNPCGLKVASLAVVKTLIPTTNDDHPLMHAQFPSWRVGALAHAQHVRAYAGWPLQPEEFIVSPRYFLVVTKYALQNWSEFGNGKWAPSPTYGTEVEQIMGKLQ